MKYCFLLFILLNFSKITFCQIKRDISISAKIIQSSSGIHKLIITFDADTSLYAVSLFHDTSMNYLTPINIVFIEDNYLTPLGTWSEYPKAEKYFHRWLGEGLCIKKRTSYTHKFSLRKRVNFNSYFEVSYLALNERESMPHKTIKFKIQYSNDKLIVKKAE